MKDFNTIQSETQISIINQFLAESTMERLFYDNKQDCLNSTSEIPEKVIDLASKEELDFTNYDYYKLNVIDNDTHIIIGYTIQDILDYIVLEHKKDFDNWWQENKEDYTIELN